MEQHIPREPGAPELIGPCQTTGLAAGAAGWSAKVSIAACQRSGSSPLGIGGGAVGAAHAASSAKQEEGAHPLRRPAARRPDRNTAASGAQATHDPGLGGEFLPGGSRVPPLDHQGYR